MFSKCEEPLPQWSIRMSCRDHSRGLEGRRDARGLHARRSRRPLLHSQNERAPSQRIASDGQRLLRPSDIRQPWKVTVRRGQFRRFRMVQKGKEVVVGVRQEVKSSVCAVDKRRMTLRSGLRRWKGRAKKTAANAIISLMEAQVASCGVIVKCFQYLRTERAGRHGDPSVA